MTTTPIRPSTIAASFGRESLSPRNVTARIAVQIGVVNSMIRIVHGQRDQRQGVEAIPLGRCIVDDVAGDMGEGTHACASPCAERTPLVSTSGSRMTKPMTERSSSTWKTLSSAVVARPAIDIPRKDVIDSAIQNASLEGSRGGCHGANVMLPPGQGFCRNR